jgi:uncharacterized protein GlcG (DUF336 family)
MTFIPCTRPLSPRAVAVALALAVATPWAAAQAVAPAAPAPATGLRTERVLTLSMANQIAAATVAACQANGHAVTAAVVDRGGLLRALHRADAAGPHTLAAAQAKAYTSASARANTLAMMENAQKNPAAANLVNIPGFLLLGGGVPVRAGGEVVGAVGVGGAPGGHLDEQCAVAALQQVQEALK